MNLTHFDKLFYHEEFLSFEKIYNKALFCNCINELFIIIYFLSVNCFATYPLQMVYNTYKNCMWILIIWIYIIKSTILCKWKEQRTKYAYMYFCIYKYIYIINDLLNAYIKLAWSLQMNTLYSIVMTSTNLMLITSYLDEIMLNSIRWMKLNIHEYVWIITVRIQQRSNHHESSDNLIYFKTRI